MMRVVLDANVFVSSLLSAAGTPARILDAWRDERFQLLISDAILDEIGRVLRYPKIVQRHLWIEAQIERFLHTLAILAIKTPGSLSVNAITGDPSDKSIATIIPLNSALYCPQSRASRTRQSGGESGRGVAIGRKTQDSSPNSAIPHRACCLETWQNYTRSRDLS